ncbi:helix-turn-helix domain-containing protein [Actinokineospora spheciospongiae]|uniref:helix-turn-helix domain-containing protein n=1 Tax=Actinokineospora spheciospongiae TaxID=909613 RepID=UPI000D70D752|nr:helix-turn-helix transcriptional regulator [Actinokineospora spheciospongiae]PWW62316.1 transcriptional regulator with XRE-family HTH domain [Actinokineospora spheciospongiae]
MHTDHSIGHRLRELREWRGLTQTVLADLAGLSRSHVTNIENGRRAVDKRSVLEALAAALRVAPSELAGQPIPRSDQLSSEAHAGIAAVEAALSDYELGQPADTPARPWDSVLADIRKLNTELRPRADYIAQGLLVPRLLSDLHASYNDDPKNRRQVLEGMMHVYRSAEVLTKNQGVQGLPQLAAFHARRVAEELGGLHWLGLATWIKLNATSGSGKARNYEQISRAISDLEPHMASPEVMQVHGMLHLYGALAKATQKDRSSTEAHLDEAASVARRLPDDVNLFGYMYFGRTNVDIWRVSLHVELGDGAKVAEIARDVRPENIPSAARQGMFYADLGRGLASDIRTRPQAVAALAKAERIAPQRVRTNPFVRETVNDLVRKAKHDSVGRELRGMAYRMGVTA